VHGDDDDDDDDDQWERNDRKFDLRFGREMAHYLNTKYVNVSCHLRACGSCSMSLR